MKFFKSIATLLAGVFLVGIFVLPSHYAEAASAFITTWTVTDGQTITIPTNSNYTYLYDVDWGDSSDDIDQAGNASHTYTNAGNYSVMITGTFPAIYFNDAAGASALTDITQWGTNPWESMENAFFGCTGLTTLSATDTPDLSGVTSMVGMFRGALNFNSDIGDWDVSNVTDMVGTFWWAQVFNQDIGSWNVSNVTDMGYMFTFAQAFNQDLSSWDVGNVTNMYYMFNTTDVFNNGDAGNTMTHPLIWNTSKVTDMQSMFYYNHAFNQDISSWDVSSVTTMGSMFQGADAFNNGGVPLNWDSKTSQVTTMQAMFNGAYAFNQDIGGWDVGSVSSMAGMFSGSGLSTANYGALLAGWSGQVLQVDVPFDAESTTYCPSSASARASIITNYSWDIIDGGAVSCSRMLIYTAGPNGSISGADSQEVGIGSDGTSITAVPRQGYHFVEWSDSSTENPRTDINVTTDISVTASFEKNSRSRVTVGGYIATPSTVQSTLVQSTAISGIISVLRYGSKGIEVTLLQKYLNSHGYVIAVTGAGSPGKETLTFGLLTQKSVQKFQKDRGLVSDGVVGPKTRALMN